MKKVLLLTLVLLVLVTACSTKTPEKDLLEEGQAFVLDLYQASPEEILADYDYNVEMTSAFTADVVKELQEDLLNNYGPLLEVREATQETAEEYELILVKVETEKASLTYQVTYDVSEQIAGFVINEVSMKEVPLVEPVDEPVKEDIKPDQLLTSFFTEDAQTFLDKTALTDQLKAALTPISMADIKGQLVQQYGAFQAAELLSESDGSAQVKAEFELAYITFSLSFKEQALAGFVIAKVEMIEKESSFIEEDITIGTTYSVEGKLMLPEGDGPFPLVILLQGSGPSDMNESIGPNAPFFDIAEGLAKEGVASLRYNKRTLTHGASLTDPSLVTISFEYLEDAKLAMALAKEHGQVDPDKIYVLGHSLGGYILPALGGEASMAGGIIMAGLTDPIYEIMPRQYEYIFLEDGVISDDEAMALEQVRAMANRIASENFTSETPAAELLGAPGSYWEFFITYDLVDRVKAFQKPLLILQGERDYQVTLADFEKYKELIGQEDNISYKTYEELNHLMMPGTGPSYPAEYQTQNRVSPELIKDIANFIKE